MNKPCQNTYNVDYMNFAMGVNGMYLPAIQYKSGGRIWYAITLDFNSLGNFINTTSAKKNDIINKEITNRFLDPKHKNGIKNYIKIEPRFTIPPITLVAKEELMFKPYTFDGYVPDLELNGSRAGVIFLPLSYRFECLDGNHRTMAIKELSEEKYEEIMGSNLLLNVVIEKDPKKIRQDFVDVNKNAKPTTASINTLFDTREKISSIIVDTIEKDDFLNNTTEKLAVSISKNSKKVFTINNIKNLIVELVGFNSTDKNSSAKVSNLLEENSNYETKLLYRIETFIKYIKSNEYIQQCINANDMIPDIRTKSILTSGSGIVIAAKVACLIFDNTESSYEGQNLLKQLFEYDWSRNNSKLKGIVMSEEGKILNSRTSLNDASSIIYNELMNNRF